MKEKSPVLGRIARIFYALFVAFIVVSVIIVWARASLVGGFVAAFMVILLIAIAWAIFRKRRQRKAK